MFMAWVASKKGPEHIILTFLSLVFIHCSSQGFVSRFSVFATEPTGLILDLCQGRWYSQSFNLGKSGFSEVGSGLLGEKSDRTVG